VTIVASRPISKLKSFVIDQTKTVSKEKGDKEND
jgi:ribosomal protein S17